MKAQITETAALLKATKSVLGLSESGRVSKSKVGGTPVSSVTEEMQVYFSKLKELVPFMPRNRKLSKLEIIQYVIDYICDLQLALEAHPGGNNARAAAAAIGLAPVNRQPLGVIANVPPNTTLTNTCAAQEANHEKLPSHLEEVNTRPVSC